MFHSTVAHPIIFTGSILRFSLTG